MNSRRRKGERHFSIFQTTDLVFQRVSRTHVVAELLEDGIIETNEG